MMQKVFLDKAGTLPTLYMDMVLVESVRPILFTCIDKDGQLYICSCCYASGDRCIWIVANTTPGNVISLLRNECEIWDMFGHSEQVAVVTKFRGSEYPEIQFLNLQEIPKELLPTKGYGMDVEDGEFDEELKELQSRLDKSEYETSFAQDSFYTMVRTFCTNIRTNFSISIPEHEYLENNIQVAFVAEA